MAASRPCGNWHGTNQSFNSTKPLRTFSPAGVERVRLGGFYFPKCLQQVVPRAPSARDRLCRRVDAQAHPALAWVEVDPADPIRCQMCRGEV